MKKTLLTAAILFAGISGMNAAQGDAVTVKDPATYLPNEGAGVYSFKSDWYVSSLAGNFSTANYPFALADGLTRTMTYANGKLYFGRRDATAGQYIDVVDAKTGAFIKTVNVSEAFKRQDGSYVSYPLNSLRTDSKGNLVMMNMVINIQAETAGAGDVQVWAMKDENDTPKLILDYKAQDLGYPGMRFDYFNVYGDVYDDGYIIGAVSGADPAVGKMVIKWDIVGGQGQVNAQGIFDIIELEGFVPSQAFNGTSIVALGSASFAQPINENMFFVDGQNTFPTVYDMEGQIVTGKSFADVPEAVKKPNTSANGVTEAKLGDSYFLLAGATPSVVSGDFQKNSFNLYKLGAGGQFDTMELVYNFSKEGFGATANPTYCLLPFIVDEGEGVASVYVFAYQNGFAKYTLHYTDKVGINDILGEDAVIAYYKGGEFSFSTDVASVKVYSIAGVEVASAKNVKNLPVDLIQGVYIVKTTNLDGVVATQKVSVK